MMDLVTAKRVSVSGDNTMDEKLNMICNSNVAKKDVDPESAKNTPSGHHDAARRKALKAGLIGVPIILTLKGQSALAAARLSGGSGGSSSIEQPTFAPKSKPHN